MTTRDRRAFDALIMIIRKMYPWHVDTFRKHVGDDVFSLAVVLEQNVSVRYHVRIDDPDLKAIALLVLPSIRPTMVCDPDGVLVIVPKM